MKRRKFIGTTLPLVILGRSKAAEADEPVLSFGVVADPQYVDADPKGSRFYRNSLGKLEEAVKELNEENLSFVVTLGDLIDRDFTSFDAVMPIYGKLKHTHHPVLGNHDFSVEGESKSKVPAAAGLKVTYYSKEIDDWRFVFLDGTDLALYRYLPGDLRHAESKEIFERFKKEKRPGAKFYSGGIGEKQMKWLETELDAAKSAKQRVVVFNHYPVIPLEHGYNLWNAKELVGLLEQYDHVAAYMNGHNHKGNYGTHKGTHYVNFKGMVETESKTAYGIVRCFPDRLEIEGYGLEPDRDLTKL
jgi:predicted phosphodiesterase